MTPTNTTSAPGVMTTRYVYEVTAIFGGRPAGHVGFATTRGRACALRCALGRRIKRVRVSADLYARIAAGEV